MVKISKSKTKYVGLTFPNQVVDFIDRLVLEGGAMSRAEFIRNATIDKLKYET